MRRASGRPDTPSPIPPVCLQPKNKNKFLNSTHARTASVATECGATECARRQKALAVRTHARARARARTRARAHRSVEKSSLFFHCMLWRTACAAAKRAYASRQNILSVPCAHTHTQTREHARTGHTSARAASSFTTSCCPTARFRRAAQAHPHRGYLT